MLSKIDEILASFNEGFSRNKPFFYFCLVIISFMLLPDDAGVTSFVRILFLEPKTYDGLIHFFNATSYDMDRILAK